MQNVTLKNMKVLKIVSKYLSENPFYHLDIMFTSLVKDIFLITIKMKIAYLQ